MDNIDALAEGLVEQFQSVEEGVRGASVNSKLKLL